MGNSKSSMKNSTSFDDLLKKVDKRDFDGHTEFSKLTYEQRLKWLSQAVIFSYKYSKTKEQTES